VQLVRLDYTVPTRRAVAHRSATLAFDLVSGAPFPLPPRGAAPSRTADADPPLPAALETAAVLRPISDLWDKLEAATRPATAERHRASLDRLGVPAAAVSVLPSAGERVLAPVFVGLLEHRRDSRVVVCSAVTGAPLAELASHLTSRLPGALEEIVSRVRPV
jgi:hypothetical protein